MNVLLFFITSVLVVLKLSDVIDVSWLIVFSPIWVPLLISFGFFIISLIFELFFTILIAFSVMLSTLCSAFAHFKKAKNKS